ncbi:DUF3048 domain-containing protein [Clostridium perfringens]|uniref:DUF3048 domain-containing protein n=1 Tax=Clostridium perfringens TaxID=1502 RepID=UPI0039E8E288
MKKIALIAFQLILSLLVGFIFGNLIMPLKTSEKIDTLKELKPIDLTMNEENPYDFDMEKLSLETLSPYTGNILESDSIDNIPFMCIIENSRAARPQSGLSEADIVYETMAEAGIPRFLAVFYENSPEVIGPVRSVRPYFLDISKEHDLPFAHCGGSAEALATISSDKSLNSINEIKNGSTFWRDNTRKAPHNLYTSAKNIRKFIADNGYEYSKNNTLSFKDNSLLNSSNYISEIKLNLSDYYKTSYKYVDGFYEKYMDGELAIDKNTNSPLKFKNIVVQITDMSLQSDNTHLDIDLTGTGEGYVFSNGRMEKIHWEKKDSNSKTTLKTEDGTPIYLSRGNTIWNIVDKNSSLSFN